MFIISHERWGEMFMSKQHYAIELARRGHEVFFINCPDRTRRLRRGEVMIEPTSHPNIKSVSHRPLIPPAFLKFKWRKAYYWLITLHIRNVCRKISRCPTLVWSFDAGNALPLAGFDSQARKIYMPVDGPFGHQFELDATDGADLIVSVTERILGRYGGIDAKKLLVNHGVAEEFIAELQPPARAGPVRVGYSGSLVRNDLDVQAFRSIITAHPHLIFEFWGENHVGKSLNHLPADVSDSTKAFLGFLKDRPNVVMHGAVRPSVLAEGLRRMDALLIAYKIANDQNHHKVLEYLGSGKVVISSFMSSYADRPDLVEMVGEGGGGDELPALFKRVISELPKHNSSDKQRHRIEHARQFTYRNQLDRILVEAGLKELIRDLDEA